MFTRGQSSHEPRDSSRRALHVLGALKPGGVENWLLQMAPHLAGSGWAFDYCLLGPEIGLYAEDFEKFGSQVLRCPLRPSPFLVPRFHRLLRRGNYEIVHSHVHHFSGLILTLAKGAGVPVRIAHSHNALDGRPDSAPRRFYRQAMRRMLSRSMTAGLACSETAAEWLPGGDGETGLAVSLLPYGIDLERFRRLQTDRGRLRREFRIPGGAPVVGYVGRLEAQKNPFFLLDIISEASRAMPGAYFVIVGDGRLRTRLEQKAEERGLGARVRFAGQRRDIPDLMVGLFDAFVLPSLWEGLPLAALEAQAAGLPTLVSDRVTSEIGVLPRISYRAPLDAGAAHWARTLREMLEARRLSPAEATSALENLRLDIASCRGRLTTIYEELIERRGVSARETGAPMQAKAGLGRS